MKINLSKEDTLFLRDLLGGCSTTFVCETILAGNNFGQWQKKDKMEIESKLEKIVDKFNAALKLL